MGIGQDRRGSRDPRQLSYRLLHAWCGESVAPLRPRPQETTDENHNAVESDDHIEFVLVCQQGKRRR